MSTWCRSADVAFEQSEDRLLLLDLADLSSLPRALTGSAATIWGILETPQSEQDLAEAVATSYDVPLEQVRESVGRFLRDLADQGLVVERPD